MRLNHAISDFHIDVLKEIGNIGAGNAATALSSLLNKPIDMKVPRVQILSFEKITDMWGGAENVVVGIYLRVEGEVPGHLYFIIDLPVVKEILSELIGTEIDQDFQLSDYETSALCEIGNIMAGSYLSSLADFTQLSLMPSVPAMAIDMAGALLSFGLMQYGVMGDQALLIDTAFYEDDKEINGHFLFIPDPGVYETMLKALGVPLE